METTTQDKLTADQVKALAEGNVDTIHASFEHMENAHLPMLLELEKAGKNRSTAIAAIEAEIEKRKAATDDGNPPEGRAYSQAEVDQLLRDRDDAHKATLARHGVELDAPAAKPLAISADADVPSCALIEPSSVLFVGEDGRPFPDYPALPFEPSDYEPKGEGVILIRAIEFDFAGGAAMATAAYLLDFEDQPVGKAELVVPFPIGGGRKSAMPERFLTFTKNG